MSAIPTESYGAELGAEALAAFDAAHDEAPAPAKDLATRLRRAGRYALTHPGAVLAALFVLLFVVCAVAPSLVAGYSSVQIFPADKLQGMTWAHPLGSDELGRDLLSRMVYAARPTAEGMVIAVGIGTVVGLTIGVVSGFLGGWIDTLLMRAIDVLLAIPALLLALAIVTAIGFGTVHVAIAVGVGSIVPAFARITRAQVLSVRTLPYVEAARTSGSTLTRVLWRHVLPNSWQPVAVLIVLDFGSAILAIAALSFLGFGPQPPATDLGSLVADGREYLQTSPWLALWPGVVVGLLVFAMNHLAKSIEEAGR